MIAIFLDGESKSGKTAVGRHIKQILESKGYKVRLIVAGNFFRTVTALALQKASVDSSDEILQAAVSEALASPALLDEFNDARLQSATVDALVSRVGMIDAVQEAAAGWRIEAADKALKDGIDVLLFDGRNLRTKLAEWSRQAGVQTALELIIYCRPEVAAKRYLADEGNKSPNAKQLSETTQSITTRRQMDRQRKEAAYQSPVNPIHLVAGKDNVKDALAIANAAHNSELPRPILFDNSEVPLAAGLATVGELAVEAVQGVDS